MTGRPIVAFALSFLFLLFLVQEGNGQETLVVSKRNLSFQKVQELFDAGQYEQAKQEIDFLLTSPQTNGIFSDQEIEKLNYIQIVCGLSQGSFSSVQDAVSVLKKTSSKELSSKLAFYLSNYFFDL